uniref:Uncharacterized protein n=1 Tax=Nothoprocta perdicaria TaxID=30464 RepID=A0A8C6ZB11_NOTPE
MGPHDLGHGSEVQMGWDGMGWDGRIQLHSREEGAPRGPRYPTRAHVAPSFMLVTLSNINIASAPASPMGLTTGTARQAPAPRGSPRSRGSPRPPAAPRDGPVDVPVAIPDGEPQLPPEETQGDESSHPAVPWAALKRRGGWGEGDGDHGCRPLPTMPPSNPHAAPATRQTQPGTGSLGNSTERHPEQPSKDMPAGTLVASSSQRAAPTGGPWHVSAAQGTLRSSPRGLGTHRVLAVDVTLAPRDPRAPGQFGNAVAVPAEKQEEAKSRWKEGNFNVYLSDLIPVDRAIADTRPAG